MMNRYFHLSEKPAYWLTLILATVSLLTVALYFQYGRGELPCLMCIQVRLWVVLLFFVAMIGFFSRYKPVFNLLPQAAVVGCGIGLLDRAYLLLGTERGFVFSDCGFSLGLPHWLALDDWLPSVFRVETSCGYTPELAFGITMAEALMVLSVVLLIVSSVVLLAGLYSVLRRKGDA
jgi:protein dithiol:quinone oxidoreductase